MDKKLLKDIRYNNNIFNHNKNNNFLMIFLLLLYHFILRKILKINVRLLQQ